LQSPLLLFFDSKMGASWQVMLQVISVAGGLFRLQLGIQSHLIQNSDEERWIAKYRSVPIHRARPSHKTPPRRREAMKIVLGSVAFGILVVVSAAYSLHFQLLK
jgi:hypothetical protein